MPQESDVATARFRSALSSLSDAVRVDGRPYNLDTFVPLAAVSGYGGDVFDYARAAVAVLARRSGVEYRRRHPYHH